MSVVSLSAAVGTNAFFKVSDVVMKALKFRSGDGGTNALSEFNVVCYCSTNGLGRHPKSMEVGFRDNSSIIMWTFLFF